ncbi:uncharacterized protein Z520_05107 [Fonsecaea multimorphosa CBS 102226]|uniref:CHAT domain-containing protein n=1 Tax=Fonsecaea multimorphosa CBS 102226 TaxID=1442371 RepID=A0A0D2IRB2_9EURO|nr:uncharacterized protein Z520_05107 [Fonsecaea multimorphosa CBS 102226]KIX99531.1 hypothetical protein Z520_05107 [Fonsecaea multimorphosa CBS 102226]
MWNPFKKARGTSTSVPVNKDGRQRQIEPLPFYEWGKHQPSFGMSQVSLRFIDHSNVWDARQDVKAYPESADKREILADCLMYQTLHWPDAKTAFFFHSGDLVRAIGEAISLTPPNQGAQLLRRESKLAMCYEKRYRLNGDRADLRSGISLAERVVRQTPSSEPAKPVRLTCLANLYGHQFERAGNPMDARSAVKYAAEAVEIAEGLESGDDDAVARLRRNLSVQLEMCANRTGSLSDLEHAIKETEHALEILSASNPDRLLYIAEMGNMRVRKFERSKDSNDLQSGISAMERAASRIPKRDAMLPRVLDNQANGYLVQYKCDGNMECLTLALETAEAAHKAQFLLDRNHPQMGRYISSVTQLYALRAQKSGRLRDEGMMVTFATNAAKRLESGHPGQAEAIECLGDAMAIEFSRETRVPWEVREEFNRLQREPQAGRSGPIDIRRINQTRTIVQVEETPFKGMNKAELYYRQAAHLENGHPFTRMRACKKLGDLRLRNRDWDEAADAYELAISLWPRLNPRTLAWEDMEYVISKLSGLGPLAATCICFSNKHGSPWRALQALESGRGIIASLTIEVSDLKMENGELYDQYMELCYRISCPLVPISNGSSKASMAAAIARRNQQVEDLKLLERKIRDMPGFQRFPSTSLATDFTELARDGPIVCFSTLGDLTNAFLVSRHRVEVIPLHDITQKDLQGHVNLLVRGKSPNQGDSTEEDDVDSTEEDEVDSIEEDDVDKRISDTLEWLWDFAVKPVLQHLGLISETPPERLPRIWWVTSGLLGLLPLHAAGKHWDTSRESTMGHAVSSYIPTFKALAYLRKKRPRPLKDPGTELLVVSMPETKGLGPLKVKPEIRGVTRSLGVNQVKSSVLTNPSREEVLEKLKSATIAHFICHGISEADSPSQSGLELDDGRLTIQELGQLSLDQVQIAYLSACSTAQNKSSTIVDESIAVASAFSLVGFPHVIGTLWEANDRVAVKIAPRFYDLLNQKMRQGFSDDDAVAHAMHHATTSLWKNRINGQQKFNLWVPFIHIGA